jgi:sugar O-acyltransferase (sialic acid O-acetyltransferase NeuD family)
MEHLWAMDVLIIGDGPYARSVIDLIHQIGTHHVVGAISVDTNPTASMQVTVIGQLDNFEELIGRTGVRHALVAIEDVGTRMNITQRIARMVPHVEFIPVVHPSAILGTSVVIGAGSVIMAGAHIDTGCTIGDHSLIGSNASIGAETVLGNFVSIGPGACLGHGCHVGSGSAIGSNAALVNKIIVGTHCVVGPCAAVIENVPDLHVAAGTPARTIRTRLVGERYP